MTQKWNNAPNRQQALETTIPTLSGLMLGFVGALLVAAAITDVTGLKETVDVYPLLSFSDKGKFNIGIERRYLVMLLSFLTGLFFYGSIAFCIWSQMSYYKDGATNCPDVQPPPNDATQEAKNNWELMKTYWENRRNKFSKLALLLFNAGALSLFLPIIVLLPSEFIALGIYIFVVLFAIYIYKWRKSS